MGPRGTSLLERIVSHVIELKITDKIELFLIFKNKHLGSGCHDPKISQHIKINTVASQVTMYFGQEMGDCDPIYEGPNLYEWYFENKSQNVDKGDYLSRKDLGEYLNHFYREQKKRMIDNNIVFHEKNEEAIDIVECENGVKIYTTQNEYLVCKCVLCNGHQTFEQSQYEYFKDISKIGELSRKTDKFSIAIQGMGLTAFDIISELTEGAGGIFQDIDNGKLKYIPSGKEPQIYLFSRSGVFLSGRAYNSDTEYIYTPRFFTKEAVDLLKKNNAKLDFRSNILPLVVKELEFAYKDRGGEGELDIDKFFAPERNLNTSSPKEFRDSFMDYLRWDIQQCRLGKFNSPYKFCQDIIRDIRDVLRYAVEYKGLTRESYQDFISAWQSIFNKICVGPPYMRLQQLEALIEAGVCSIEYAKYPKINKGDKYMLYSTYDRENNEVEVDSLIKARIPSLNYRNSKDLLISNISKRYKLFRYGDFFHGGLEIDKTHRIKTESGKVCENIYGLGLITEGSKYFTLVLGRPNMISTFLYDNNKVASHLLGSFI
ncbi:hypothetical protein JBKA6_0572 [Ichthyobacterium seriolicida]|uniref:FAD-dependent urate hydroxylase HpyO/Asp monooxygenase CreE-like FAD/NAD(P)-binding domain-containing protein n=2 Tax=Ichthyobacterium seriolicida TaxID=242600 RepID=A0A1J1DXM6_9FLAO|nr:hypothetical protein JBKA6_0572 [Ichthyobacterium seriolicida]